MRMTGTHGPTPTLVGSLPFVLATAQFCSTHTVRSDHGARHLNTVVRKSTGTRREARPSETALHRLNPYIVDSALTGSPSAMCSFTPTNMASIRHFRRVWLRLRPLAPSRSPAARELMREPLPHTFSPSALTCRCTPTSRLCCIGVDLVVIDYLGTPIDVTVPPVYYGSHYWRPTTPQPAHGTSCLVYVPHSAHAIGSSQSRTACQRMYPPCVER